MDRPKELRLTKSKALNTSVPSTGKFQVPLNYGSGLYACHLNLAETTVHGGSLNSPNFNIRPNLANSPITWNSNSDSGPTTTTVSTSTSASVSVLTSVAISTITRAAAFSPSAATESATWTRSASLLPSSISSPSQSNHPSTGIIVGASIAGLIGLCSLIVAILLYVRTRSRRRRETSQSPQDKAHNEGGNHWRPAELTGLNRVIETDGQQNLNRELHGYPIIAIGHSLAVGELEGRG